MTVVGLFRRYKRWNPVHPTYGAFWGVGVGLGCGVGWGPGFGPEAVGFVGAGCGVGFSVGVTLIGVGVGLPASGLTCLPVHALVWTGRGASKVTSNFLIPALIFSAQQSWSVLSTQSIALDKWARREIPNSRQYIEYLQQRFSRIAHDYPNERSSRSQKIQPSLNYRETTSEGSTRSQNVQFSKSYKFVEDLPHNSSLSLPSSTNPLPSTLSEDSDVKPGAAICKTNWPPHSPKKSEVQFHPVGGNQRGDSHQLSLPMLKKVVILDDWLVLPENVARDFGMEFLLSSQFLLASWNFFYALLMIYIQLVTMNS